MPERLRRAIELLSGYYLGDVRVHASSGWPARVGARAFALGTDIHLAPGAEDALPHEAWHVVQQKQGRVEPTGRACGVAVNEDSGLEREAHVMGEQAARLSRSPVLGDSGRVCLSPGLVPRPVMQRWIIVGGHGQPMEPREVRANLSLAATPMTGANTPYLQQAVEDLSGCNREFSSWDALRAELKRRSFGHRHRAAMVALYTQDAAAKANYTLTRTATQLRRTLSQFRGVSHGRLPGLEQRLGAVPFILWMAKTDLGGLSRNSEQRSSQIFQWIRNQTNTPTHMNCWECVLYSGAWTGNTAPALYSRDYAFWALQVVTIPTQTFPNANGAVVATTASVPTFLSSIIANPLYHGTEVDPAALEGKPPLPNHIPAGAIVVFSCSQHVALATGARRNNQDELALEVYGLSGHEILELDSTTDGIQYTTIEDILCERNTYSHEVHIGWLPENTTTRTVALQDLTRTPAGVLHQVNLPATNFYT